MDSGRFTARLNKLSLKRFKDLPRLQLNMGHHDISLLRSRYVNMRGISHADTRKFSTNYHRGCRRIPDYIGYFMSVDIWFCTSLPFGKEFRENTDKMLKIYFPMKIDFQKVNYYRVTITESELSSKYKNKLNWGTTNKCMRRPMPALIIAQ